MNYNNKKQQQQQNKTNNTPFYISLVKIISYAYC